jgi:hypothetical protein
MPNNIERPGICALSIKTVRKEPHGSGLHPKLTKGNSVNDANALPNAQLPGVPLALDWREEKGDRVRHCGGPRNGRHAAQNCQPARRRIRATLNSATHSISLRIAFLLERRRANSRSVHKGSLPIRL